MRNRIHRSGRRRRSGAPAVIFDLDGALIHSTPDIAAAANRILVEDGAPALPEAVVAGMVGGGAPRFMERAYAAAGLSLQDYPDALNRFLAAYHAGPVSKTRPFPGVDPMLRRLKRAGVRTALCTNKPRAATERVLQRLNWTGYFDLVLAGDDLPFKKPDPRPIRIILDLLGAARRDTLFVGDTWVDIAAAKAAGLPVALMSQGYAPDPASSMGADFILNSPRMLNRLVRLS